MNAFRYLLKPVTEKDISSVMMEVRRELETAHTLSVRISGCELLL